MTDGDRYFHLGPIEVYDAGNGLSSVIGTDGEVEILRAADVRLLRSYVVPRTLENYSGDEHTARRNRRHSLAVARTLQRFVRHGWLREFSRESTSPNRGPSDQVSGTLSRLLIPTCQRPTALPRVLSSYLASSLRGDQALSAIVSDDSTSPQVLSTNIATMREAQRRFRTPLRYIAASHRRSYSKTLSEATGAPRAVTDFCLLGGKTSAAIGANRNALLLESLGELVYFADDDTVANLRRSPEFSTELAISSQDNPLELWIDDQIDSTSRVVDPSDRDETVFTLHEKYLGKRVSEILFEHSDSLPLSFPDYPIGTIDEANARVVMSSFGSTGDCGWDNKQFFLLQNDSTFARFTASKETWEAAYGNRNVVQTSTRVLLSPRAEPKFAMALALDNRWGSLPPFPPVGRAEEVGFGTVLSLVNTRDASVTLPWTIDHQPAEFRDFKDRGVLDVGLGSWLPACLADIEVSPSMQPGARLAAVGQYLMYLGRLSTRSFQFYLQRVGLRAVQSLGRAIEDRYGSMSVEERWTRDAGEYMSCSRRQAASPASSWCDNAGGLEKFQEQVHLYGQLLKWWPDLLKGVESLRERDIRLSVGL